MLIFREKMKKTGIGYNPVFLEHSCTWDPAHPESPRRLETVEGILSSDWAKASTLLFSVFWLFCFVSIILCFWGREANEEELQLCHTLEWLEKFRTTQFMSESELKEFSKIYDEEYPDKYYDEVYFNSSTYKAAKIAVGTCLDLLNALWKGQIQNGFALVRPPGHHAGASGPNGFCTLNNIAITAKYALEKLNAQRVLIVDWDVHHGQGTQDLFYDDGRVLYFSWHRYEYGKFWPFLERSNANFIGEGAGKGRNINFPLNKIGLDDSNFLAVFLHILIPISLEFNTDLVLVSCGFDPGPNDPEGEMRCSPTFFAQATHILKGLAHGRLLLLLEGGYNLESTWASIEACTRVLCNQSPPRLYGSAKAIADTTQETLTFLLGHLQPHWNSLGLLPASQHSKWPSAKRVEPESSVTGQLDLNMAKLEVWKRELPPLKPISVAYNEEMMKHKCRESHPESPFRIKSIYTMLESKGMLKDAVLISGRRAVQSEIELVHKRGYIEKIAQSAKLSPSELEEEESQYDSVYLNQFSHDSALLAVGSLLEVVDSVLNGKSENGVAVVRPPGHHALEDEANGFCLFNNVAIAAQYARKVHGVEKVMILDWDVHHGQGIQQVFYEDPSVLYVSLHRYDGGFFFPGSNSGNWDRIGEGAGKGRNLNVPWNTTRKRPMGDQEYLAAFFQVVLPVCFEFNPDLVLVSAGFDAARGDPLGNYAVTPGAYAIMSHALRCLADGKVIMALEGGYNLESISQSMLACVQALKGLPLVRMGTKFKDCLAWETLRNVIEHQSPHWESLSNIQLSVTEIAPVSVGESETAGLSDMGPLQAALEEMHRVTPLLTCPHLSQVTSVSDLGIRVKDPCKVCGNVGENWICLTCFKVGCSRYVGSHGVVHHSESGHPLALSFSDLTVWCYVCDDYVHNEAFHAAKRAAHLDKFGCEP